MLKLGYCFPPIKISGYVPDYHINLYQNFTATYCVVIQFLVTFS